MTRHTNNLFDVVLRDPLFLGFDNIFGRLNESLDSPMKNLTFPYYNVTAHKNADGENTKFVIDVALAGYTKADIHLEVEKNQLTLTGTPAEGGAGANEGGVVVQHHGIAKRAFTRRWTLADTVEVVDADLKDGILSITLVNSIPEKEKARQIKIG